MSLQSRDKLLGITLSCFAWISGSIILGIVVFLFKEAWPAISSGKVLQFFQDIEWRPGSERDPKFGIGSMLFASFSITILAGLIAVPLGVFGAVFGVFYCGARMGALHQQMLEVLAGVPSVIFGFWGLTVLVPMINRIHSPGQSLLAAGLVLAIMILPTVSLTSIVALKSVDPGLITGVAALGISRPVSIWTVILPAAGSGIASGCILAVTRAVGETMAVVMVCGNIAKFPSNIFDPVRPVTATIALEMGYATSDHKSLLFAAGLVLVLTTSVLVWVRMKKGGVA